MTPTFAMGLRWMGTGLLAAFSFLQAGAQTPVAAFSASAPGVTQAMRDVKLSVTVAGRIESLLVSEGSRVRQGELLLHLDRTLEQLEVQRRRLLLQDHVRIDELKQKEQVLQQQLKTAGFGLTIKNSSAPDLFGTILPDGDFDLGIGDFRPGIANPLKGCVWPT